MLRPLLLLNLLFFFLGGHNYFWADAYGVLEDSIIQLNCEGASGGISCDWKCYDACVTPYGPTLSLSQLLSCLRNVDGECSIPGAAHSSFTPSWSCTTDDTSSVSDDTNVVRGYVIEPPLLPDAPSLKIATRSISAFSIDIQADFDRTYCRSQIRYAASYRDPTYKNCHNFTSVPSINTASAFGFNIINLNFSAWAHQFELNNDTQFGTQNTLIQLSTLGNCWNNATQMTLYHTTAFTVLSHAFDHAHANLSPFNLFLITTTTLLFFLTASN